MTNLNNPVYELRIKNNTSYLWRLLYGPIVHTHTMIKIGIFLISFLLLFVACKQQNATPKTGEIMETSGALPPDFESFYQKFLTDSLYQIAHITWPLQGLKTIQIDSTTPGTSDLYWTLSEWRMHRIDMIKSGENKRKFQTIGDVMVIEQVRALSVPYGIERRYAKQANNEWELIYYAATHEMKE